MDFSATDFSAIDLSPETFARNNGLPLYQFKDIQTDEVENHIDFISYRGHVHPMNIHGWYPMYDHGKPPNGGFRYKNRELSLQEARATLIDSFMPAVSNSDKQSEKAEYQAFITAAV
jgi:hypothetical protein